MFSINDNAFELAVLLERLEVPASEAPHLTQTTCSGLRATPHCRQNFLCPVGFIPQDIQATACSEIELPQFVQNTFAGGGDTMGGACAGWTGDGAATPKFNPGICPASPVCPSSVSSGVVGTMTPFAAKERNCWSLTVCFVPFSSV